MKLLYTLFLTVSSLLPVTTFAQPQKGSITINPQLIISEWSFKSPPELSNQYYVIGSSFHYYIGHKFALGVWLYGDYYHSDAKTINTYSARRYNIIVSPELHYSFLRTRFTPFIRIRAGEVGYSHYFLDNPVLPVRARRGGSFVTNAPPYRSSISLGLAYFIKDRFALTGQLSLLPFEPYYFANPTFGIGGQF